MNNMLLEDIVPWNILHAEGRYIIDNITSAWKNLVNDKDVREPSYHDYLKENAGLFLCTGDHQLIAISKLKLGSGLETDFVVPTDLASYGFAYKFIELESPHSPPYNKNGSPSSRLTHAVGQIQDWRRWLRANISEAKRIFPSKEFLAHDEANFLFTIIIGTRENTKGWLTKRNDFGNTLDIHIRSFDYLIDQITNRQFHFTPIVASSEFDRLSLKVKNELANPFFKAYEHHVWKKFVNHPDFDTAHMIAKNVNILLSHRQYSEHFDRLLSFWESLPDTKKSHYFRILKNWGIT